MAGEVFSYFIAVDPVVTPLPLPTQNSDRIPVVRGTYPNQATYYVAPQDVGGGVSPYVYVQPVTGDTLTAAEDQAAYVIDPAAALNDLTVVLPPGPSDGAIFEVSTTQDINNFSAQAPGGAGVFGTFPIVLAENSGISWRYVALQSFWFRRF
jgi:hypothetical protein